MWTVRSFARKTEKLIEDRDAAGEVATVYDEWRAKSGRQKVPGILKCFSHRPDFPRDQIQRHGSFFPRSSGPKDQGSDCELGFVAQSLSVLADSYALPACSGSRRKHGAGDEWVD